MKHKLLFLIFLIVMGMSAFGQETVTLTFTGQEKNGTYVQLYKVTITNTYRGWSEDIFFPDTVYTLSVGVGIDHYGQISEKEIQIMPNPFDSKTKVNIYSTENTPAKLEIVDMMGRKYAECSSDLTQGNNYYELTLNTPQTYLLSVHTKFGTRSVKMINTGHRGNNSIFRTGEGKQVAKVLVESTRSHDFMPGDLMIYTGYSQQGERVFASSPFRHAQETSEEITLLFDIHNDKACPGTPTVTDVDGNIYSTVQIGSQCWMKEDLRTTHYADNTPITLTDEYDYESEDPLRKIPTCADYYGEPVDVPEYGYLYNWPAVMHGSASSDADPSGCQGICPDGWHVPSRSEWLQLRDFVSSQPEYLCNGNPANIAQALADSIGWLPNYSDNGCSLNAPCSNATGFSALPVSRGYGGIYSREYSCWSASRSYSLLYGEYSDLKINDGGGYCSVRCLRDDARPIVSTVGVEAITPYTAICEGSVSAEGGSPVTARGFCWSIEENPSLDDSYTVSGGGQGGFTDTISDLTIGTAVYVRAYATNSTGTAYGAPIKYTPANPEDGQPCQGSPTLSDFDGNEYQTVQIGTQCWMKENLRTTHYADGEPIEMGNFSNAESSTVAYRYAPYNDTNRIAALGYLYNRRAMSRNSYSNSNPSTLQGVCPDGWHVPSHAEFLQLTAYVQSQPQYVCGGNEYYDAKALSATSGWYSWSESCTPGCNQNQNNATGFSAKPAGFHGEEYEQFGSINNMCAFFHTSNYFSNYSWAYIRWRISAVRESLQFQDVPNTASYSVRCVKNQ